MTLTNSQMIQKAKSIARLHHASDEVRIGEVGCVLLTEKNNIFMGVSIHACCGVGFCAEHSAIAAMVLNQEYKIKKIVAVSGDGTVLPPCGRCREFMYQIDKANYDTDIIIEKNKTVKLRNLLPMIWQEKFY
ncbi:MAG: cytidine deaminase [Nanoarchaeota archaeon]